MGWGFYREYVPVAERRAKAAAKIAKVKKAGRDISPVEIAGRKIATTFWGQAWCTNLEAYSDYANRLPRGRTYVRNGSVLDLQVQAGSVRALVSGSSIYEVNIEIGSLDQDQWTNIKRQCAHQITSLIELLQGSVSKGVMEVVSRKGEGLFPSPHEICLSCSCPDWATMCKHVAATLYGVGARLDHAPELLFTLRGVDPAEMVEAAIAQPATRRSSRRAPVLETDELSSVFGVDIDLGEFGQEESAPAEAETRTVATRPKAGPKPQSAKMAPDKATTKKTVEKAAPRKTAKTKAAPKKAAERRPAQGKPTQKRATPKRPTKDDASEKATKTGKLDALAARQNEAWDDVEHLVASRTPRAYDAAVQIIIDLWDLADRDGDASFEVRLEDFRRRHARKRTFLRQLLFAEHDELS